MVLKSVASPVVNETNGREREDRFDVAIIGGGLAGLCLALELKREAGARRIAVLERAGPRFPEAAHKVGESSVEVSSHYMGRLGLEDLLADEMPKFGLRFFFSAAGNRTVSERPELGPSHFLSVPSFQIDRGHFETQLTERVRKAGIHWIGDARVREVALLGCDPDHALTVEEAGKTRRLAARWVVDASGTRSVLKRKFQLAKRSRHGGNSAWFRVDKALRVEDWQAGGEWAQGFEAPRSISTNHLMGKGYWVWLIPLRKGRTSVGIVADEQLHPFEEMSRFDRARAWLGRHEPQLADALADTEPLDFLAVRHYSREVQQCFSAERWCIVGDAAGFADPLYSPGNDFIAMGNGFAADLIARDLAAEDITLRAEVFDRTLRSLLRTYLVIYHRQYALMGDPKVMSTKVVWDFVMYWGGLAQVFFANALTDLEQMGGVKPLLERFGALNVRTQALFRDWAKAREAKGVSPPPAGRFFDYSELSFLADLNRALLEPCDGDGLLGRLEENLALAGSLRGEILAEAQRDGVTAAAAGPAPSRPLLTELFATMNP